MSHMHLYHGTYLILPLSGGNNAVKAKYNRCGCVYRMRIGNSKLNGGMKAMIPTTMETFWCGNTANGTDADNACDVNSLANPDNIAYAVGLHKVRWMVPRSYVECGSLPCLALCPRSRQWLRRTRADKSPPLTCQRWPTRTASRVLRACTTLGAAAACFLACLLCV